MGTPAKQLTEKQAEIREEYLKTLQDLTFNSKPLIDVLTEVAEENKDFAPTIVNCIKDQLENVSHFNTFNRSRRLISFSAWRPFVYPSPDTSATYS